MTDRVKKAFLRGAGSVLDLFPPLVEVEPTARKLYTPARSTAEALRRDWERVVGDIARAYHLAVHEQDKTPQA